MRFLALLLTALTAVDPAWTQTKPNDQNAAAEAQPALRVQVVDDPGPSVPNSTALRGFAIQVTDPSGAPVADAAVALRLPEEGATGHFDGGLRAWVGYTDAAGLARFPVIQWEGSVGLAELRVTAAKGSAHAGFILREQVGADKAASVPAPAAEVKAAKVALPDAPEVSMETPPASPALDDIVPMPMSKTGAPVPDPTLKPDLSAPTQTHASTPEPKVSITNSGTGAGSQGSSRKKWMVIAAIGAAAGLGGFLALSGHGAAGSKTSASGVTFGTPTYPTTVSH
jgi:hypothetical protein